MAITKPTLKPISSSTICIPYQYGHGWQRERKMHQNEAIDYSLVSIPHSNLGQPIPPKKRFLNMLKQLCFGVFFFWLRNIYAHIHLLFPTFIEKYLIEFGP